jgi:hypothetical protein
MVRIPPASGKITWGEGKGKWREGKEERGEKGDLFGRTT